MADYWYNGTVANFEEEIKRRAFEIGFDAVGITDVAPISNRHIEYLKHWLDSGCAAQMSYMHRNFDKRTNPAMLMDGAKSIICVAVNYKTEEVFTPKNGIKYCKISSYACYVDYHNILKEKLHLLGEFIKENLSSSCKYKVCVDSVPIAERALAERAGIGFIAKNHMLTHPILGQQLFLGELITSLYLKPDKPIKNECSGCAQCIKACPAGAISADGFFDSRRCISYLTIEHKGVIPKALTAKVGRRLFGCDECVLGCRRHKNAPLASKMLNFHKPLQYMDLKKVIDMEESEFERIFGRSPIERVGLERLKRNAVVCMQNISSI